MLILESTHNKNPDFLTLVAELDEELYALYGEEEKEYEQFNNLEDVRYVIVAYDEGMPVGCGCYRPYNETTCELKRIFVKEQNRCRGIATQIINKLEDLATTDGFSDIILETGDKQPESINLYTKLGYKRIAPYHVFIGMEHSVCMTKVLTLFAKNV